MNGAAVLEEPIQDACAHELFSRLLIANQGRICGFIYTLAHDREATQELFQEVSMVLWKKFDLFDHSTDFAVWAMSVARLCVFEWRRKQKHLKLQLDDSVLSLLADEAMAVALKTDERKGALRQCLEHLEEKDRELLDSRFELKKSVSTIAGMSGVTRIAIYKRLNKLYFKLLECIRRRLLLVNEDLS